MFLPSFGAREHKKMQFVRFGGLDLRAKAPAGTLSQCENMSADAYPALTPRKPRRLVTAADGITALAAPEYTELPLTAFTGVRNRHFYYQGTRVSDAELLPGEKSIADFNGKLCILPDKLYYDYQPDPDTGETAAGLQSMEKALTLSGVTFYASHSTLTGAYTAYLSKSGGGFDQFQPGESLVISGCTKKGEQHLPPSGTQGFCIKHGHCQRCGGVRNGRQTGFAALYQTGRTSAVFQRN